ncbi:hypothetical protein BH09ACT6_BH09ACT6_01160 [soil metagenome]
MSSNGWQFDWSWLFGAFVIIGVVLIVVVVIRLVLSRRPIAGSTSAPVAEVAEPTPRQILDARYARGELTTDEYRERVATLGRAS